MLTVPRTPRLAWFAVVTALHAVVILALVNTVGHFPGRSVEPRSLVAIFIRDDDGTPPGPSGDRRHRTEEREVRRLHASEAKRNLLPRTGS